MNHNELSFSGLTYLEAVCRLQRRTGCVHPVDLANDLQVSKPSVTRAMRLLADEGLIEKNPGGEILLTPKGVLTADSMCEKCKMLREFWKQTIGSDSGLSCRDIVRLSYSMSDEIVREIKNFLQKTRPAVPAAVCG